MSVVIAAHPETGAWATPSKNPEFMQVRLESKQIVKDGNFMRVAKRSAFTTIPTADKELFEEMGYKVGYKLPGKIVKEWSFIPFYEGQAPTINPTSGEIALRDGKEYFLHFYHTEDESVLDNQEVIPAGARFVKEVDETPF